MAPPGSLYFHLSAPVEEEQRYLESASLLLHLPPAPGPHHTHARILVHYLARDKNTGLPTKLIVSFILLDICAFFIIILDSTFCEQIIAHNNQKIKFTIPQK